MTWVLNSTMPLEFRGALSRIDDDGIERIIRIDRENAQRPSTSRKALLLPQDTPAASGALCVMTSLGQTRGASPTAIRREMIAARYQCPFFDMESSSSGHVRVCRQQTGEDGHPWTTEEGIWV